MSNHKKVVELAEGVFEVASYSEQTVMNFNPGFTNQGIVVVSTDVEVEPYVLVDEEILVLYPTLDKLSQSEIVIDDEEVELLAEMKALEEASIADLTEWEQRLSNK